MKSASAIATYLILLIVATAVPRLHAEDVLGDLMLLAQPSAGSNARTYRPPARGGTTGDPGFGEGLHVHQAQYDVVPAKPQYGPTGDSDIGEGLYLWTPKKNLVPAANGQPAPSPCANVPWPSNWAGTGQWYSRSCTVDLSRCCRGGADGSVDRVVYGAACVRRALDVDHVQEHGRGPVRGRPTYHLVPLKVQRAYGGGYHLKFQVTKTFVDAKGRHCRQMVNHPAFIGCRSEAQAIARCLGQPL